MARFNFGKRTSEEEEIPPEPIEGETEIGRPTDVIGGGGRMRRPLIFALVGVLLVGGAYLANVLFFSAPPPPSIPTRPAVPVPPATAPAQRPQTKEVPPAPPTATTKQPEVKAEVKAPSPQPMPPAKTAPPTPPVKQAPEPAPPAKAVAPAVSPPASKAPPAPAGKTAPELAGKAEKQPPLKSASTAKGFSVQVGAMAQAANAESLKQKLDGMGFQAVVRKGSGFANSHVVTVGEPGGKREAEDLARQLNVSGFPTQLAVFEGKYVPQAGTFVNLDEAIDLARELQKKNYRPKITSKPATTVLYQVRHGQFDTKAAAMKRGEELKAKGFSAWVVPN